MVLNIFWWNLPRGHRGQVPGVLCQVIEDSAQGEAEACGAKSWRKSPLLKGPLIHLPSGND